MTFLSVCRCLCVYLYLSLCVFYYLGIDLRLSPMWNASKLTALSQISHGLLSPPISLLLFLCPPFLCFPQCWFSVRISKCFGSAACKSAITGPDKFSVCICSSVKLRVRFISLCLSLSLLVCGRVHYMRHGEVCYTGAFVCASVLMSFQCPRLEFPLNFTTSETQQVSVNLSDPFHFPG